MKAFGNAIFYISSSTKLNYSCSHGRQQKQAWNIKFNSFIDYLKTIFSQVEKKL